MNDKIPCTVYVLTLNSEAVLERALKTLGDFAEILVCDGNSTDRTLDIARRYGARIIKQSDSDEPNKRLEDFAVVRNRCIDEATYDWMLQVDSDEIIGPEIVEEIRGIVSRPIEHCLYQVPNRIIFRGKVIRYSTAYPGYQMRFFNRRCGARYERTPHSRFVYDTAKYSVGYLKNPWYVFVEATDGLARHYVAIEARGLLRLPTWQFIRWGVLNRIYRVVKLAAKVTWLYVRHGFKDTMPPSAEYMRVRYAAAVMFTAIRWRLRVGKPDPV